MFDIRSMYSETNDKMSCKRCDFKKKHGVQIRKERRNLGIKETKLKEAEKHSWQRWRSHSSKHVGSQSQPFKHVTVADELIPSQLTTKNVKFSEILR